MNWTVEANILAEDRSPRESGRGFERLTSTKTRKNNNMQWQWSGGTVIETSVEEWGDIHIKDEYKDEQLMVYKLALSLMEILGRCLTEQLISVK